MTFWGQWPSLITVSRSKSKSAFTRLLSFLNKQCIWSRSPSWFSPFFWTESKMREKKKKGPRNHLKDQRNLFPELKGFKDPGNLLKHHCNPLKDLRHPFKDKLSFLSVPPRTLLEPLELPERPYRLFKNPWNRLRDPWKSQSIMAWRQQKTDLMRRPRCPHGDDLKGNLVSSSAH